MLKEKVEQYIRAHRLFCHDQRLLIALSGGADSVALLCVLQELGYACVCAHCNFHLRGAESDEDEQFVRELCARKDVPLFVKHFDTKAYAQAEKVSIEMAARALRYAWFRQLKEEQNCAFIVTGHHADDNIETLLLHLLRGTGIHGLRGMLPCQQEICRPLLSCYRTELLEYLAQQQQGYVTDSTNDEEKYQRNRVRHTLLPLLRTFNPNISETLTGTIERLTEVERIYRQAICDEQQRICIAPHTFSIPLLLLSPAPKTLLHECFHPFGFTATQIENIHDSLTGESGKLFHSPSHTLLKDRDTLILRVRKEEADALPLLTVREVSIKDVHWDNPYLIYIDAEKVTGEITLRKWQSGDWFIPFGMRQRKKVRDFLRDEKLSIFEKEAQYVAVCGEMIIWVVGRRTDQRVRITEQTKKVFQLSISKPDIGKKEG